MRLADNRSHGEEFEMDPPEIPGEVPHPFCFFGIKPTLFDAPSRGSRADLDWLAHSFLCHIADRSSREIRALTGFAWGFNVVSGAALLTAPVALEAAEWDQHLGLLRASYPVWSFGPGMGTISAEAAVRR